MKITDQELLQLIWINQLRLVTKGVLHNYIGGGVGVCNDNNFWYEAASGEHVRNRCRVTDVIKPPQLLARIRTLAASGRISFPGELTFFIKNETAFEAFKFARQFWMNHGVPTGMEDGKKRSANVDVDALSKYCEKSLIQKFIIFENQND